MLNEVVQNVRFKRGTKQLLEDRLKSTDLGVLESGEPAFETDTGQLKIGNGVNDYIDLPYVGQGGSGGLDPRFEITDPESGQILVYDADKGKWVNKTTIYTYATDNIIDGKVYHVLWKIKPTVYNTVYGLATNPDNGSTFEVISKEGVIATSKLVAESSTISDSEIEKLFSKIF